MSAQRAPNAGPKSGELAAEVVQDVNRLVGLEVALAKQELKELAIGNAIAAACMAAGGLLAIVAILVAVPVAVVMLVPWHWEAAAVWAVAYLLLAIVLGLAGRARLRIALPPKTVASLKETKTWALRRMRSTGR
ncbi:MAG TPA: phage holin family protein [Candidatus Dormibacteraeota bacterium]|nr:phage holin family protein [Candidatus Dormibacteraeota bacterium]